MTQMNPAVAAAAAASNPVDFQRNLVALATQFGLKDTNNFDQIIQDMNANNEKSKLLTTHTPMPAGGKINKKKYLLSASLNTTPNQVPTPPNAKPKNVYNKKKLAAAHFQDSSNLLTTAPNGNQTNAAAVAAAAAALQYHQFLNSQFGNTNGNLSASSTPNGKYLPNGKMNDDENNRGYDDEYDEQNAENYDDEEMKEQHGSMKGEPLAQSNTNTSQNGGAVMNSNYEFECNACEKKFKYFCYYKRHMDACHSEWPKYVCDTCNKSYKWEASFRQHLRSHHGITTNTSTTPGQTDMNGSSNGAMNGGESNQMNEDEMNGNESLNEYKENLDDDGHDEDEDIDSQEQDIEQQINQSQNEPKSHYMCGDRDTEQIGAAGTLASIADAVWALSISYFLFSFFLIN